MRQDTVIFVSLFGVSESVTRNLLCHFERLNIWNYIFLGPESDFLFDLSRRGHAVINADRISNNVKASKLMTSENSNGDELIEEISLKAYVIKKCTEYKFNCWMVEGNMLFLSSNLFLESIGTNYDFYVGKDLEVFYARSSSSAGKLVEDFLSKVVAAVESSRRHSSSSEGISFVRIAAKLLEEKGARVKSVEETSFGLSTVTSNVNQSSLEGGKKIVFWSTDVGLDEIQMRLQDLGLWLVDNDSSCTAVVCRGL